MLPRAKQECVGTTQLCAHLRQPTCHHANTTPRCIMSLLHNQIDFLLLLLHYFKLAYMTSFMVIKWCLGYYKWLCCGAKWTIALQHSVMTKNETCVLKLRSHIIVSLRLYQHVFAIACLLPFDLMYVDLFCHHDGAQLLVLLPLLTIQWMYASKISMLIIHVCYASHMIFPWMSHSTIHVLLPSKVILSQREWYHLPYISISIYA